MCLDDGQPSGPMRLFGVGPEELMILGLNGVSLQLHIFILVISALVAGLAGSLALVHKVPRLLSRRGHEAGEVLLDVTDLAAEEAGAGLGDGGRVAG